MIINLIPGEVLKHDFILQSLIKKSTVYQSPYKSLPRRSLILITLLLKEVVPPAP